MRSPIWAFDDYKKFLASLIETSPRGQVSRLAEAAGCQRSYLSNVLRTHIHLMPDQAFGICRHLALSETETEYFLVLLDHDRCATPAYRHHLKEKLRQLQLENQDLSKRLDRPPLSNEAARLTYYSSWHYSAIHILASIPGFGSVSAIARALSLDPAMVRQALSELESMGLVARTGDQWRFHSGDIHVPRSSPLVTLHHNNWRQQALLHAQSRKEGTHFTMVQSVSVEAAAEIREKALALIDEINRLAGPSPAESLVYFGLDEFRIA